MTQTRKNKWDGQPDPFGDAMRELARRHRLGVDVRAEFYVLILPVTRGIAWERSDRLHRLALGIDDAATDAAFEAWKTWSKNPGTRPAATAYKCARRGMRVVEAQALGMGMGRAKYEKLLKGEKDPLGRVPVGHDPIELRYNAGHSDDALAANPSTRWDPQEILECDEKQQLDHAVLEDMRLQAGIGPEKLAQALAGDLGPQAMQSFYAAMRAAAERDDREVPWVKSDAMPVRGVQAALWDDPETVQHLIVGQPPQEPEDDEDGEEEGQAASM
jgi:hypothetical protein